MKQPNPVMIGPVALEPWYGVAENQPLFISEHPWIAYVGGRIVGFFSNYKCACAMALLRRRGRLTSSCRVVNANSGEMYPAHVKKKDAAATASTIEQLDEQPDGALRQ